MKRKSIDSMMLGLAAISVILFSHGIVSYAQDNYSNATASVNTSISTSNSTLANNATSQSGNPTVQSIDAAIKSLKDAAKKLLLKAEESLEGKSDLVDAEKRVEASLAALKDGDINAAISHAEEAKKNLS